MPVAAVLGWPLEHTLSPVLHQAAYRAAGLDDWSYQALPTRPEALAAVLDRVRSGALAGVNLTTPLKRDAVGLVDELRPPADELGAVNTVWRLGGPATPGAATPGAAGPGLATPSPATPGPATPSPATPGPATPSPAAPGPAGPGPARLAGGNTDVAGALWALERQLGLAATSWTGQGPALLLGTGGVAVAVALAWRRLEAARARRGLATCPLTVAGRNRERAAEVAAHAGPGAELIGWDQAAEAVARAAVLVQATTLTAHGEPVPGQDRLRAGGRVLDLNYGPSAQGLVEAAHRAGAAAAVDGLGMLCAQAAEAVTLIAGIQADVTAMAAAVSLELPHHPVGRVAPK
jgi:shikimate 5-dehydrogenase